MGDVETSLGVVEKRFCSPLKEGIECSVPTLVDDEESFISNIGPVPHISQSVLTFGNVLWIASTILFVGFVLPLKIELRVAFEMPILPANACWFMC